jgi:hypothetical protein
VAAALDFYSTFEARIDDEVRTLRELGITLIVGDIPPLAFAAGAGAGIPAVAVANFTWDWIYEEHPGFLPAGARVLETIKTAYRSATHALELPFAGGFDIFSNVSRLPLVARRPTRSRADTRRHFDLPATGRVALLSFGGYGLPQLDLASVDCRDDWTIATTDLSSPIRVVTGTCRGRCALRRSRGRRRRGHYKAGLRHHLRVHCRRDGDGLHVARAVP